MERKIKTAKIYDYRGYEESRCCDGGAYGFWKIFEYAGDGMYSEKNYTTCDGFDYCAVCGNFNCDRDHEGWGEVTEQELLRLIAKAENDPSDDVGAKVSEWLPDDWATKLRRRVRDALNKTASEKQLLEVAYVLKVKTD